ncbi:MAG: HAMP domain-containing protein [Actinobacteria bacterium]|nr:HAMP domain-containing protein [Actinomycetota bacterium]
MGKGRSRLLYQITLMLVIVLVIIGVTVFLVVNGAMDRLIEEDKQDRIDSEAQIIYNDAVYISDIQLAQMLVDFPELDVAEVLAAVKEKRMHEFIAYANEGLKEGLEAGMLGAETVMIADPTGSTSLGYPFALACSDDDLTYEEIPENIITAFEEDEHYIYLEEGIPELGFEGEYLVTLVSLRPQGIPTEYIFLGIRPFAEEIARIDDFYSSERNRVTWILALVIGGGIVLIFLITFFILQRMINKQITRPIDELTAVAGEVMDGNLDVEIDIREGEEFETLKRAFREMLVSIRDVLNKSIGKE